MHVSKMPKAKQPSSSWPWGPHKPVKKKKEEKKTKKKKPGGENGGKKQSPEKSSKTSPNKRSQSQPPNSKSTGTGGATKRTKSQPPPGRRQGSENGKTKLNKPTSTTQVGKTSGTTNQGINNRKPAGNKVPNNNKTVTAKSSAVTATHVDGKVKSNGSPNKTNQKQNTAETKIQPKGKPAVANDAKKTTVKNMNNKKNANTINFTELNKNNAVIPSKSSVPKAQPSKQSVKNDTQIASGSSVSGKNAVAASGEKEPQTVKGSRQTIASKQADVILPTVNDQNKNKESARKPVVTNNTRGQNTQKAVQTSSSGSKTTVSVTNGNKSAVDTPVPVSTSEKSIKLNTERQLTTTYSQKTEVRKPEFIEQDPPAKRKIGNNQVHPMHSQGSPIMAKKTPKRDVVSSQKMPAVVSSSFSEGSPIKEKKTSKTDVVSNQKKPVVVLSSLSEGSPIKEKKFTKTNAASSQKTTVVVPSSLGEGSPITAQKTPKTDVVTSEKTPAGVSSSISEGSQIKEKKTPKTDVVSSQKTPAVVLSSLSEGNPIRAKKAPKTDVVTSKQLPVVVMSSLSTSKDSKAKQSTDLSPEQVRVSETRFGEGHVIIIDRTPQKPSGKEKEDSSKWRPYAIGITVFFILIILGALAGMTYALVTGNFPFDISPPPAWTGNGDGRSGVSIIQTYGKEPCLSNPCSNSSICVETSLGFKCVCTLCDCVELSGAAGPDCEYILELETCGLGESFRAYPHDCSKYIDCGVPTVRSCPQGLVYDPTSSNIPPCSTAVADSECSKITRPILPTTPGNTGGCNSSPCQNGGTCIPESGGGYTCICSKCGCVQDGGLAGVNCEYLPDLQVCNATEVGFKQDPNFCRSYLVCSQSAFFTQEFCSFGQTFDVNWDPNIPGLTRNELCIPESTPSLDCKNPTRTTYS